MLSHFFVTDSSAFLVTDSLVFFLVTDSSAFTSGKSTNLFWITTPSPQCLHFHPSHLSHSSHQSHLSHSSQPSHSSHKCPCGSHSHNRLNYQESSEVPSTLKLILSIFRFSIKGSRETFLKKNSYPHSSGFRLFRNPKISTE